MTAFFLKFFSVFLSVSVVIAVEADSNCSRECPLWTTMNNDSCVCECADSLNGTVHCEDNHGALDVTNCFCMTYDDNRSLPVGGPCLYKCLLSGTASVHDLQTNISSELNYRTCGRYKRTGVLCSKCIEGYGLPVYSYNLSCVNCTEFKPGNVAKYLAVTYLPLTLFYFIVIMFRISATSGLLVGYVTISQMLTAGIITWLLEISNTPKLGKMFVFFISVWNLDFLRSVIPPFCISPNLSSLHVLYLDYLVAVYPLFLIFITYIAVKLHDRFELFVWFCKPLYICFHKFRKEWDIKTSLVASFATFYLLSYVKIINVTAGVLTPTYYFAMNRSYSIVKMYDPNISYLSRQVPDLPLAVFAVIFSFLFNVCPLLLLCLYPCTCFHKCLNKTRCRCHTLHVFMDALLGTYAHRPRERRYFGALYLIIRILHVAAFNLLNVFTYLTAATYVVAIIVVLIAIFRPYANRWHNIIDVTLFLASLSCYFSLIFVHEGSMYGTMKFLYGRPIHNFFHYMFFCICLGTVFVRHCSPSQNRTTIELCLQQIKVSG